MIQLQIISMKIFNRNIRNRLLGAILAIAPGLAGLSSCSGVIYDDLDPCPEGLRLRFIYDYNMEFANAFPSQVHCLTLLVYDEQGRYVETRTVTDPQLLSDENWRMDVDLPEGKYRLLAYGGMACDQASFHFMNGPSEADPMQSLQVAMNDDILQRPTGTQLHHLFYGALDVEVKESAIAYQEYTLPMMKDTNNIRILLQNVNGTPVDDRDYTFEITDDNTLLDWQNLPVANGTFTYLPWTQGQVNGGEVPGGDRSVLAFAEFSTSRLMARSDARLTIKRRSDGGEVLSIPLITYLQLLRSQEYADMAPQEFLDRESRWNLILFLNEGNWITTTIVINGWVVRINNIEGL